MRKITQTVVSAFLNRQPAKVGNTRTDGFTLWLHNNAIAFYLPEEKTYLVTNAGWFSNTTKERLNAIPGVSIFQKAGKWFLNGNEWDGQTVAIK